ncbi:MAG TPA: sialate O-acetylesterase [Steroidobacteraceae bacterium]|nr:sialate O-acetylesterase [Steroidobacteraceae bacterium]
MPLPIRRRKFLLATAASGSALLGTPVSRTIGAEQPAGIDQDFHVYLAFGQSNMEGFPGIEAQDKVDVDARFQMLAAVDFASQGRSRGQWYPAVPPLCRSSTGLCPADYFGRTLVSRLPRRVRVGVVNVAVAGCKIELFDRDTYEAYAATAAPWMKTIIEGYGGSPYQRLVDMARVAMQKGVIKGVLLHQGESNTNDAEWPGKVARIYRNLLADLKLDASGVPLLAGETVNADQQGAAASVNEIIAQLPKVVATAHVVSSRGCESRPDRLHFTPAGYRELGRRYAETVLALA